MLVGISTVTLVVFIKTVEFGDIVVALLTTFDIIVIGVGRVPLTHLTLSANSKTSFSGSYSKLSGHLFLTVRVLVHIMKWLHDVGSTIFDALGLPTHSLLCAANCSKSKRRVKMMDFLWVGSITLTKLNKKRILFLGMKASRSKT